MVTNVTTMTTIITAITTMSIAANELAVSSDCLSKSEVDVGVAVL